MDAFELDDLLSSLKDSGRLYIEFLRSHDLSVGLYTLAAGAVDPQGPHTEDEIYHVVSGRARIAVGDEDRAVGPGSIVFVAADVPHRFHDIDEDLTVLVVFGPAEYTHRVDHEHGQSSDRWLAGASPRSSESEERNPPEVAGSERRRPPGVEPHG